MKKSIKKPFIFSASAATKAMISIVILGGLLLSYNISASKASVLPPDGEGVHEIYVDNVIGNDETGDGSMEKPYKTIEKGNYIGNNSGAPLVRLHVKGTKVPYRLVDDIYPKRNSMEFLAWNGRPRVIGHPPIEDFGQSKFDVQKFAGIVLQGFDFQDVTVEIRSAMNVTIRDNRIIVTDPERVVQHNRSAVIDVHKWEGEWIEYNNDNLEIFNNQVAIKAASSQPMIAIRLDSANGSSIYQNTFAPYSDAATNSVVTVLGDSSGLVMKANKYASANALKISQPVYNLIKLENSKIF